MAGFLGICHKVLKECEQHTVQETGAKRTEDSIPLHSPVRLLNSDKEKTSTSHSSFLLGYKELFAF